MKTYLCASLTRLVHEIDVGSKGRSKMWDMRFVKFPIQVWIEETRVEFIDEGFEMG